MAAYKALFNNSQGTRYLRTFCPQNRQNISVRIFTDYASSTVRQRTTMVNAGHTEYKKFSCLSIKILNLRTDWRLVILQLTFEKRYMKTANFTRAFDLECGEDMLSRIQSKIF